MQLTPSQVLRFYGIWFPLLRFVNSKRKVVNPSLLFGDSMNPADILPVRDALWADDSLLDKFVRENPVNLSAEDLAVAKGWRTRVAETFYVIKHLKNHSIFLSEADQDYEADDECGADSTKIYAVVGLTSPLDETLMFAPLCMIKTVLIPFEGQVTYDSLLVSYPMSFGRNITARLNRNYQAAKKRGAIISSLERPKLVLV